MIHKFKENPKLEKQRVALSRRADEIFERIRASIKGSEKHLFQLKEFEKINNRTRKFLQKFLGYFMNKRHELLMRGALHRPWVQEQNKFSGALMKNGGPAITRAGGDS